MKGKHAPSAASGFTLSRYIPPAFSIAYYLFVLIHAVVWCSDSISISLLDMSLLRCSLGTWYLKHLKMSSLPRSSTSPAGSLSILSDLVDGIILSPGLESEWLPYHLPLPLFPGLINNSPVHHYSLYFTELTLISIPSAAVC